MGNCRGGILSEEARVN